MNKPSYQVSDSQGNCSDPKRVGALSRQNIHGHHQGKLYLSKISLNQGGYDTNGMYFGHDVDSNRPASARRRTYTNVYWCASADGLTDFCFQATCREEAKEIVTQIHAKAKFFR